MQGGGRAIHQATHNLSPRQSMATFLASVLFVDPYNLLLSSRPILNRAHMLSHRGLESWHVSSHTTVGYRGQPESVFLALTPFFVFILINDAPLSCIGHYGFIAIFPIRVKQRQ